MLKIKEKELLFKLLSANNQVQTEVTDLLQDALILENPRTSYFWALKVHLLTIFGLFVHFG